MRKIQRRIGGRIKRLGGFAGRRANVAGVQPIGLVTLRARSDIWVTLERRRTTAAG
jgi:hypothetical protein